MNFLGKARAKEPCLGCQAKNEHIGYLRADNMRFLAEIEHLTSEILKLKREGFVPQLVISDENSQVPRPRLPQPVIEAINEMSSGDSRLYDELFTWALREYDPANEESDPEELADRIYRGARAPV